MTTKFASAVALAVVSSACAGPFQFVSLDATSESQADAFYFGPPEDFDFETDTVPATSFAQFPISSNANASTIIASASGSGSIEATQLTNGFSGSSDAIGSASGGSFDSGGNGSCSNNLRIDFVVTRPCLMRLDYTLFVDGFGQIGNAGIGLQRSGFTIFSEDAFDFGETTDSFVSTLAAGEYSLAAGAGGSGFAEEFNPDSSSSGSFFFTMTFRESFCPVDYNLNLTVDVNDLLLFLSLWFDTSPVADFDCDGVTNVNDLLAFIGRYFQGC